MRVAGWASRRWIRIAMISLVFLGIAVLIAQAIGDGSALSAVALAALAIPLMWIVKSGVEAFSSVQRLRKKSDELSLEAKRLETLLVSMNGASAEIIAAMERHDSDQNEQMSAAVRRIEVIEADRLKVAFELQRSLSRGKRAEGKHVELSRRLDELAATSEAHRSRISKLEPPKQPISLPPGAKPEMNLAWAFGSLRDAAPGMPVRAHDDESKEPGAGGSRESNG